MSEADPPQPSFAGALDIALPVRVGGWAMRSGDAEPVQVEILVNGERVATVRADQPRPQQLQQGKHPTGRCGFTWKPAQPLAVGSEVRACCVGADADLPGSPKRITKATAAGAAGAAGAGKKQAAKLQQEGKGTLLVDSDVARIVTAQDISDLPATPLLPPAPPRSSLRIFSHSLWAFFLREFRSRYSEYRLGYVWAILQPLAYIVLLRGARSSFRGSGGHTDIYNVSFLYFLALGIVPFFMWQHSFHRAMGAMSSFSGMYAYRQLQPIDVVLARVMLESLNMVVMFIILMFGFWWFDVSMEADDVLLFFAAVFLVFVMALGMGLFADVYVSRDREVQQVFRMVERPLFFISGVFFVAADLSEGMRYWLMWNPLLHALDLGRDAMLVQYTSPCSWWYLIVCSISIFALGLAAYRRNLNELSQ